MAETARNVSLDGLLAVWSRRKWLAMLAFVAPMAAAVSLLTFLPNIYRSTATVLVDRQQVPEKFVHSTVTSALETRLHTISHEILSRSRLEALINRFGLYSDLRKRLMRDRKSTRLNSSHANISYAVFCLKKKKKKTNMQTNTKYIVMNSILNIA